MNQIQENHLINICKSYHTDESFTGLWCHIAKQQNFIRLVIPSSTHTPTREMIACAIQQQKNGDPSSYSSRVFDIYHVIYQKRNIVIVTNAPPPFLGTFFAVEDTDYPNRYFIAFAFPVGEFIEIITGIMVYFNEKGTCFSDRTIVCERVLVNYDTRNGLIREPHLFLYHQSLVFTQVHRDTDKLHLFLSYIPYHSDIIEDFTSYYMDYVVSPSTYQTSTSSTSSTSTSIFVNSITLFKRYLSIPLLSDSTLFLDLGSLHTIEEKCLNQNTLKTAPAAAIPGATAETAGAGAIAEAAEATAEYYTNRYFTLTTYEIIKKNHILEFLDIAQSIPEYEYSDGYPIVCTKCQKKASTAIYEYKEIRSGLGSAYCPDCRIRYSLSSKEWVCAKIRVDGSICNSSFHSDWQCHESHFHSQDQYVVSISSGLLPKYPYRDTLQLQWFPTEDASICADIAPTKFGFYRSKSVIPPLKVNDDT